MGNWDSYRDDLDALKIKLEKLFEVRNDVMIRRVRIAEEEEQEMMKPTDEAEQLWLSKVQAVETEVDDLIRQISQEIEELHPGGFCSRNLLNMPSSYEFEDIVADKLQAVMNLIIEGVAFVVADDEARVVTIPKDEGVAENLPEDVLYDEGTIVGMESIFTKVWRCLEEEGGKGGRYVGIIGLYGMGGVGKTTLLKQIYRNMLDNYGQNNFAVVIWVSVSKELRLEKIQEKIGKKIGLFDKVWKNKNFEDKASDILKILKEKKFVLLMDELWERVDLTKVGVPFPNPENSSKIVFTTRSLEICRFMEADRQFKMNCLSEEEAWKLFETLVGDETLHSHPEQVVDIGRDISKECSGLPLALVSIGRALAGNKTPQEWRDVLGVLTRRSQSKSSISGSDDQLKKDIYYNLKLSYDHLQNDIFKSCLLYCCLFPRNDKISKVHLIDCWIGEEFLDDRLGAQSQGYHIIDVLLSACLLEEEEEDDNYVKMHNWIHDMTLWITTEIEEEKINFFVCADADLTEPPEIEKWVNMTRISMTKNGFTNLENAPKCSHLQTLFLNKNKIKKIGGDFFRSMRCLKVLNLSDNELPELPSEISYLVSLQHLDLSRTAIKSLPNQLGELKKLKCLNLEDTSQLYAIPPRLISTLSVLHVLRLRGCGFFDQSGEDSVVCKDAQLLIEELFCLKNLSMLSIGLRNSHALQKLLSSYRLQSCIQSLWLHSLQHPKSIVISLSYMNHLKTLRISECEYLEELEVDFVGEAQAQAISNFYFLDEVIIESCPNLQDLTWLILAPNLKHLEISQCSELEEIIKVWKLSECPELMRNFTPFLKLHFLKLSNLPKLRSIYWCDLLFPDLKDRIITECPKLQINIPPHRFNKDHSKEKITVNVPSGPSVPFLFSKESKDREDEELVKIVECRENLIYSTPQIKHDVFLSFRGIDTRNTFVSHLCKALRDKQIETFIDDKHLNRGDEISPSLLSAIEESHISIVIFSKNYASSRWCLEELVKIVECWENHKQIVIPVFYEIDPSDVRNQTGSYAEAFAQQEHCLNKVQRVQTWKDALKQVANLSGFDSRVIKPESVLINIIVDDVLKKLDNVPPSYYTNLPGMNSRTQQIGSLLRRGDVCGSFGGVGISNLIDKSLITKSGDKLTMHDLLQAMGKEIVRQESTDDPCKRTRLWHHKDIYDVLTKDKRTEMIEGIFLDMSSLNARDINLTPRAFTKMEKLRPLNFYVSHYCGNKVHVSEDLVESDFIELKYFHWYRCPLKSLQSKSHFENLVILEMRDSNFEELWSKDVQPLHNLKSIDLSWSQHLISLPDLSTAPNLENLILKGCESLSEIPSSIQHLNKLKSLRLSWCTSLSEIPSSIQHLNKLESLMLEGCTSLSEIPSSIQHLNKLKSLLLEGCTSLSEIPSSIQHLNKLKSLKLTGCTSLSEIPSSIQHLNKLERLTLRGCTSLSEIPSSIQHLNKLEMLVLSGCTSLSEIPSSIQHLNKLEYLHLDHCERLESIPDCTGLESLKVLLLKGCSKLKRLQQLPTNLEKIDLEDCTSLVEIQSSFTRLHKVCTLTLHGHKSLTSIPDLRGLKSLIRLSISDCSKLKMLPELPNTIKELTLEEVSIEEFPPSSEDLDRLRSLRLINCSMLKSLPTSVRKWKSLCTFNLQNCSKIDKLPDDIGALESLGWFMAEGTAIGEVPSSISCLKSLRYLSINRRGVDGVGLLLPPNLLGLENLSNLDLSDCGITKLPDSLGDLTSLDKLDLKRNNFVSIPGSIINLSKLEFLDISYCEMLRELPQLPALTTIKAVNCTSLERLFQNDILQIREANFINCYNLDPDALNDVVKDTLLKIQGQAALLVKKDTLPKRTYYEQVYSFTIYPESKIPEWFHYQSRGSFIDVKLPPLCLNCNFLCFALCVVVAIPNPDRQCNHPDDGYHGSSNVTYDCCAKSKDGNRRVESNSFGYHGYTGKPHHFFKMPTCGPDYMKSNHVIIGISFYIFHEICENELSFRFYVENFSSDDEEHFNVEMCGVHLISGLRFETSNESKEEDESHLEESDEEDEPHPNRLKHFE